MPKRNISAFASADAMSAATPLTRIFLAMVMIGAAPTLAAPTNGSETLCEQAQHIPIPPTGAAAIAGTIAAGDAHYYSFDLPPNTAIAFFGTTAHVGWNELAIYGPDCGMAFGMGFNTPNFGGALPADFTGDEGGRWVLGVHLLDAGPVGHGAYTMEVWPCLSGSSNPCLPY
jgi:hypothetical protein